jgi:hypothetical protein
VTGAEPPSKASNRRVLHVTCRIHGGAAGYTNLVIIKLDSLIELDPHAIGCVIILDEKAATELFDALVEWLG